MAVCGSCKGQKIISIPANRSPLGIATNIVCPDCRGTGGSGKPIVCPRCDGTKRAVLNVNGINIEVNCPECLLESIRQ